MEWFAGAFRTFGEQKALVIPRHVPRENAPIQLEQLARDPVYATLFPPEVQEVIGKPNDTARAALRILEKIGFRPLHQVDPFDGGHLGLETLALLALGPRAFPPL